MKKRVENENNEASSINNAGSVNSQHRASQMVHRRASSITNRVLKKLRILLKFLLFREDEPKHSVWTDFNPIHLALVLPLSIAPAVGLTLIGYLFFGVVGFFVAYATAIVLVIEIPHCIFDR